MPNINLHIHGKAAVGFLGWVLFALLAGGIAYLEFDVLRAALRGKVDAHTGASK